MEDVQLERGDIVEQNGVKLEVTGISYQENDQGEKLNLTYLLRPHETVEAERKAEAEHQEELVLRAKEQAKESDELPAEG